MKVHIIACGRLKDRHFQAAAADYRQRLDSYCKLTVREVKDESALLAAVPQRAHLYVLDERGDLITSQDLADILDGEAMSGGGAPVVFAIGGADGHSDVVRARAKRLLAFGRITIAHRLVRVVLLEQVYRAFRISRGHPYHRD